MYQGQARAYTNIALIKYWGKKDQKLRLPQNSSLSLTLDGLYTDTRVSFSENYEKDTFFLNGENQSPAETQKISKYIDIFREAKNINLPFRVESYNVMPTAAGFASSASGYAALATALNSALELNLGKTELSKLARLGSGSACRSIFPGLVEWQKGTDHDSSYAKSIDPADWGLVAITVNLSSRKKKHSSSTAMQSSVETSPYYSTWVDYAETALAEIKEAIKAIDIDKIGEIAEQNALAMHSLALTSKPPVIYFNGDSLKCIEAILEMRESGLSAYFTMDAGPNLVVLCPEAQAQEIMAKLEDTLAEAKLYLHQPGPGALELESWDHA